jgi:hypothetical protein
LAEWLAAGRESDVEAASTVPTNVLQILLIAFIVALLLINVECIVSALMTF